MSDQTEPAPGAQETIHFIADGDAVTSCCGRTPFELPRSDRITVDPALTNCEPAPVASREQIVADFIAQREEYVRVLKQCVDADADYHRWQGHAEARRQLRDKLLRAGESNG